MFGVAAVVVSLVYLAAQIRQSARVSSAAAFQGIIDGITEHFRYMYAPENAELVAKGGRNSEPLAKDGERAMSGARVATVLGCLISMGAIPVAAQVRPDFSGVWRLVPEESRMVGGGGAPSEDHQVTWLVNHRDPEIGVVVNVRDARGSHEFSFRCTTDGKECLNDLPSISEERRMSAVWDGPVLVMSQQASAPHGDFETRDRLILTESGERLVFERIVINKRGERSVRQVFRKLGPHPSQPDLDSVIRP